MLDLRLYALQIISNLRFVSLPRVETEPLVWRQMESVYAAVTTLGSSVKVNKARRTLVMGAARRSAKTIRLLNGLCT